MTPPHCQRALEELCFTTTAGILPAQASETVLHSFNSAANSARNRISWGQGEKVLVHVIDKPRTKNNSKTLMGSQLRKAASHTKSSTLTEINFQDLEALQFSSKVYFIFSVNTLKQLE